MEEELIKRSKSLANNLAYNSQYWVITNYRSEIQKLISGIMNEEDIIYAVIIDRDGKIIGHNNINKIGTGIDTAPLAFENYNGPDVLIETHSGLLNTYLFHFHIIQFLP